MTSEEPVFGTIFWQDLTVPDSRTVRDFYSAVVGWHVAPIEAGGENDFTMTATPGGEPVAGICAAEGENADLPPQWLMYITVPDLDVAMGATAANGGAVIAGPKGAAGEGRYAVIRDPAGAVCALWEPAAPGAVGG